MNFRNTIVFALMLTAAPAVVHASPFVVLEKEQVSETSLINASFEVNRELGRAWVEIQISDSGSSGDDAIVGVIRKQIEGLSYDQAKNQVVYVNGARSVVCAVESGFLFQKSLKPTGDCAISISSENRIRDDGFELSSQVVSKVLFDPKA